MEASGINLYNACSYMAQALDVMEAMEAMKAQRLKRETLEQLKIQKGERRKKVAESGGIELNKGTYYPELLEQSLDKTVMDLIEGMDVPIKDYLAADEDAIVFMIQNLRGPVSYFGTFRSQARLFLGRYECTFSDSARSFTGNRYVMLASLGCPCTGVASYYPFKVLLEDTPLNFFVLKETPRMTRTLMAHTARYMDDSYVGNAHCQAGSEQRYYQILIPDSVFDVFINLFTDHETATYISWSKIKEKDVTIRLLMSLPSADAQKLAKKYPKKVDSLVLLPAGKELSVDEYLGLAHNARIPSAQILIINWMGMRAIHGPREHVPLWIAENPGILPYLFRLAPPYRHSVEACSMRATIPHPEALDHLVDYRTPWQAQTKTSLPTKTYEMLMGWIGEVLGQYDSFKIPDILRAIYITNEAINILNITRSEYQLAASAGMFIMQYANGHTIGGMLLNERTLNDATANTYTNQRIMKMVDIICSRMPYSMYVKLNTEDVPLDNRQAAIYRPEFLTDPKQAKLSPSAQELPAGVRLLK